MTITVSANPSKQQLSCLLEYYQAGRYSSAEKLALSITREFPEHKFGWKVLGAVLGQTGRNSEAIKANQTAVTLSPQDAQAHNNLGITLQELGRLGEAETSYAKAISLKPDYAEAHYNLGITLQRLGRLEEAEASYSKAISFQANSAEAYSNLGVTLQKLGRLEEAEASYSKAISIKPNYAEAHYNLGVMLQELRRLDEAKAAYERAISLKPEHAETHSNLGVTLQKLGEFSQAEESYKQAISLKPEHAETHRYLTLIKKFEFQDEQYAKMLELYHSESISDEQRCHINFGLAKACEDLGDFEQAFAYYIEGNATRKKLLKYDLNRDIKIFNQIKSNSQWIIQNSLESDNLARNLIPVFIVGMPRSGTTLVEQIISSHPNVSAAGELPYVAEFGELIGRGLSKMNRSALQRFREKYFKKLQTMAKDKLIVTDKMPQNFRLLGLIAAAFPEAKIVHVKRNAAAVCWANYTQYFPSKNLGYCYALADVIEYYKMYTNLMEFWNQSLDGRIHELDYELLVVNQESETKKLIGYLGLDWDRKCLSPQDNKRSVATASSIQVRQKVYQGSSDKWKRYKPFLNGALDGF